MEEFPLIEAYMQIKYGTSEPWLLEKLVHGPGPVNVVVYPTCHEPPEGVSKGGKYHLSLIRDEVYFVLKPELSKKIATDYKGLGTKALTDGLTMTVNGVVQKPRPVLGHLKHLGLSDKIAKKSIARLTHDNDGNLMIVAHDDDGADYAQNLWESLVKKD